MVAVVLMLLSGCGQWEMYFGPSQSSFTSVVWNNVDKELELIADRRGTQSGCTTVWFDWTVSSGHYDPRAARDCHPTPDAANRRARGYWYEMSKVTDIQKAAACTSGLEPPNTNPGSNCHARPGSTSIEGFAKFSQTNCISWRLRTANGSLQINSGGRADDCSR